MHKNVIMFPITAYLCLIYFIVGTTLSATEICDTPKKVQKQDYSLLRKAFATDPHGLAAKRHALIECLEPYLLPKDLVTLILQYDESLPQSLLGTRLRNPQQYDRSTIWQQKITKKLEQHSNLPHVLIQLTAAYITPFSVHAQFDICDKDVALSQTWYKILTCRTKLLVISDSPTHRSARNMSNIGQLVPQYMWRMYNIIDGSVIGERPIARKVQQLPTQVTISPDALSVIMYSCNNNILTVIDSNYNSQYREIDLESANFLLHKQSMIAASARYRLIAKLNLNKSIKITHAINNSGTMPFQLNKLPQDRFAVNYTKNAASKKPSSVVFFNIDSLRQLNKVTIHFSKLPYSYNKYEPHLCDDNNLILRCNRTDQQSRSTSRPYDYYLLNIAKDGSADSPTPVTPVAYQHELRDRSPFATYNGRYALISRTGDLYIGNVNNKTLYRAMPNIVAGDKINHLSLQWDAEGFSMFDGRAITIFDDTNLAHLDQ